MLGDGSMAWEDLPVMRALLTVAGSGRTEWEGPQFSSDTLAPSWSAAAPDEPESDEPGIDSATSVAGVE